MKQSALILASALATVLVVSLVVGVQVGQGLAKDGNARPSRPRVVTKIEKVAARGMVPAHPTPLARGLCTHLGFEYVAEWTSPARSTASVLCRGRGHYVSDTRPFYLIWRVADGAVWTDKVLDW